jgi:YHS domain-containing protein
MVAKGFITGREKKVATEIPKKGEDTRQDPVCGTYVTEADAVIGRYEGERIFFCSMACLEKYKEQLEHKG